MWIRSCEGTSVTTTSLSCSAERIKNFRTYARTGEKQDKKSIKTLFHKIIEKLPLNIFSPRSTPLVVVDVSDCANENNIELDRRERSPNWFIAVASAEYQLGEALPLHTTQKFDCSVLKAFSGDFNTKWKILKCLEVSGQESNVVWVQTWQSSIKLWSSNIFCNNWKVYKIFKLWKASSKWRSLIKADKVFKQ